MWFFFGCVVLGVIVTFVAYHVERVIMAAFDDAVQALSDKVDQLIDVVVEGQDDDQELADAIARADAEKARADAVLADDAASDEAQDQARADALAAITAKADAVLNPAPPVE